MYFYIWKSLQCNKPLNVPLDVWYRAANFIFLNRVWHNLWDFSDIVSERVKTVPGYGVRCLSTVLDRVSERVSEN